MEYKLLHFLFYLLHTYGTLLSLSIHFNQENIFFPIWFKCIRILSGTDRIFPFDYWQYFYNYLQSHNHHFYFFFICKCDLFVRRIISNLKITEEWRALKTTEALCWSHFSGHLWTVEFNWATAGTGCREEGASWHF